MGAIGAGDLGGTIDLEVSDGESDATILSRSLAFLQRVESKTGKVPMIYVSPGFWNGLSGSKAGFEHFTLWIAHWDTNCPDVPSPWTSLKFWQYADNGSIPGVSGGVDHDLFNGSDDALKAFAGSTPDPGLTQVNGNDGISAVNWADDKHVELFVKSPNGDVNHVWSKGADDTWNAPAKLDGGGECGFGSVMWAAPYSYPEVISPLAPNGNVGHLWWVSATGWNTFKDLGGSKLSHVSTITWPDTHAELFALGSDGTIWHDPFVFANSDWSGWTSMGGANLVTGAAPIRWSDGHVELFATDAQGTVWHDWSGNFTGGWHGWDQLGGAIASRPVPVRWADGHVEVFATGKDGHLYHSDWASSAWPVPSVIDAATTIVGEPSAIMNPKGGGGAVGPEIFARNDQGKVVHLWWDGTKFTDFVKLGDQDAGGDPFGWTRADNSGEVFVIDGEGQLAKSARDATGAWSSWTSIASGPYSTCAKPLEENGSGGGGQGGGTGHHPVGPSSGAGNPGAGGAGGGYDGDAPGPDGACSCRVGEPSGDTSAWMLLGVALIPLLRRRRRA